MCLSVYSEFVEFSSNADWGYILAIRQCRRKPLGPGRCK